ncbi:ethanolamine ammonia-lyase subunit EutC [Guptibacillus algicola]|uniref:ethanolamine ammonia-lyase subunit EutC n=1 Tax=Guptibacillus algicola TaxID=225844 RepID=UPI001CD4826E|nr:ethanolamine ammonia-lyase subunit EutC [Alkalihalobacillus algicola]MCA0988667.1 ethanolamine ammonia-lyase subunit EutC [Alkalihalobacillus algicola]
MNIEQIVKEVIKEMEVEARSETKKRSNNKTREFVYSAEKRVTVDSPVNQDSIELAQSQTPARIGIGHSGTRMKTKNYLDFRIDHAAAQDAVMKDVSTSVLKEMKLPNLSSKASSMEEYLMNLDVGRSLDENSVEWLKENGVKGKQVQIIISDGLSSTGIEETVPDLLPALIQGLEGKGITIGVPVFIRKSRVWIQDEVARLVDCDLVVSLIGERPGLATSKSISAYLIYRPNENSVEADRTVFSNIHSGGVPPIEAGAYLSDVIEEMLNYQASGVKYSQMK